jgi:transposase InsO family protein
MSKARLIITAVTIEGRSQHEVARAYGISQSWVSRLVARYHAEGEAAFQPRSRRPKTSPTAIAPATVTLITELRAKLTTAGLDAGPDTIAWHLAHHHNTRVSTATISRYLTRLGLVTPQPTKRPNASYQRFQAQLPNECWQADFTHYPLAGPADGPADAPARDTEILTWLDDHSRYALDVTAHQPVTGPIVRDRFLAAVARYGPPASTLTDNGMVFTTRFAGGRGGRNALEAELHRHNVQQKNSRPNKPTTCGKVERFQQTLKQWLRAQPQQPTNLAGLQQLLDQFVTVYNQQRVRHEAPHDRTEVKDLRRVCQGNGVTGAGGLLPAGAEAPVEGDVEGVEGGLPSVGPPPAAAPGRVQADDGQVQALEGGLLGREVPAGADRAAEAGVEALDRVGRGDHGADLGVKVEERDELGPRGLP